MGRKRWSRDTRCCSRSRVICRYFSSSRSASVPTGPGSPERWVLPYLRSGGRNHALQLLAGVSATRSTHYVLHDADLFFLQDDLLERQYLECCERQLDCLGISPVWDPWFQEHGLRLAATWDLVASVAWMRQFSPYVHMGHDGELFGETHTFDTTLYPQSLSAPERIDWVDRTEGFVHFNYVITTYRDFQKSQVEFVDSDFRLLLITLFAHLFSDGHSPADLPPFSELFSNYQSGRGSIRFPVGEAATTKWKDFRGRLDRVLDAPFVSRDAAIEAVKALCAFDEFYGV